MLISQNRWVAGKNFSEGLLLGLVTALGSENRP